MKGISRFAKVKEDKDSAYFVNGEGHAMHVAKSALSAAARKQIESLALEMQHLDKGGLVDPIAPDAPPQEAPQSTPVPTAEQQLMMSIPPAQEAPAPAPAAQEQVAPAPVQSSSGLEQQMAGQKALGAALGKQGDEAAKATGQYIASLQKGKSAAENLQDFEVNDKKFQQAVSESKIDPDRYWNNHSRLTAGIGAILSGIGGGLAQDRGAALANYMNIINHGIANDIRAQESDKDTKMSLWKMNQQAYGNKVAADITTKAQMSNIYLAKLQQVAQQSANPIAKANAQIAIGGIQQQLNELNVQKSIVLGKFNSPEEKVAALLKSGTIKPPEAAKILEEVKSHRNIVSLAPKLEEAFNLAKGDRRSVKGVLPGFMSSGQSSLKGLLNTTVGEKEGSSAVAAMKGVSDTQTPGFLDTEADAEAKRNLMHNYVKSNDSTPFSKAAGIDLGEYPDTNLHGLFQSAPKVDPNKEYETKTINGKQYKVPVREKK